MFWDGSRWVDGRLAAPATPTHHRHRRLGDWLATIPIMLLVPALAIPMLTVSASSGTLAVSGVAVPGGQIAVAGQNLPKRDWVQLRWDGSTDGMITVRTRG